MPREIIRPAFGEPCLMQLACPPEGTQREGSYGVDWQYELNHDQAITWLPNEARAAILAAGIQEGDEIALTKTKRGRQTIWIVERISDETRQTAGAPPPAAQPAAAPPAAATAPKPDAAPAPPPEPARPGAQLLAGALYAAIDAALAAEAYAQAKGLKLQMGKDDIRAMAISLYIDARKEAR